MPIGIMAAIGLACGLIIYLIYIKVPQKVKGLEKTEEITSILPGMNCGACGYPGCFAYAQALSQDPDLVTKTPCSQVLQDPNSLEKLEKALGCKLDAAAMSKKALVKCSGNSEVICNYSGAQTCKAAAQLLRGYKTCPYACLGLNDCVEICPQGAISMDPDKNVAVVDPAQCTGCGLCVTECPQGLIELVPAGTKIALLCNYQPLKNIPGRERCDFGCIRCRKCVKACEDEAVTWNQETALPEFNQEKCTLCLKCVEVCPQQTLAEFAKMGERKEAELVSAK